MLQLSQNSWSSPGQGPLVGYYSDLIASSLYYLNYSNIILELEVVAISTWDGKGTCTFDVVKIDLLKLRKTRLAINSFMDRTESCDKRRND